MSQKMSRKDDTGLSEDEMDAIVERVVEELQAGRARDEAAETGATDEPDERAGGVDDPTAEDDDERIEAGEPGRERRERGCRDRAERVEDRAERLEEQVERGSERLERLGERIEAEVERGLDRLADTLERSLDGGPARSPPPRPAGPDLGRERAVYKTQLQKGGRVAVPDAEIEALDLEPGDTLQVTLYEVD